MFWIFRVISSSSSKTGQNAGMGVATQPTGPAARFVGHYTDQLSKRFAVERAQANALSVSVVGRANATRQQWLAPLHGGRLSLWDLTGTLTAEGDIAWSNTVVWHRCSSSACKAHHQHAATHHTSRLATNGSVGARSENGHASRMMAGGSDQDKERCRTRGRDDSVPMRIGVLVAGLLRGLTDQAERQQTALLLDALGPRQSVHCFAAFGSLHGNEANCSAPLRRARAVLSAHEQRFAKVRLVTRAEESEAAASCVVWPQCPGFLLQFHKVWLAWKMLEQYEVASSYEGPFGGEAVRFDVVVKLRTDQNLTRPLDHVSALLARAASALPGSPGLSMQGDLFWAASRGVAAPIASAWSTMTSRSLLMLKSGPRAWQAALVHVAWSRVARSTWAQHSLFLKCMPYPDQSGWEEGWSLARVRGLAANGSAASSHLLQAQLNATGVVWRVGPLCPWINYFRRDTAARLDWLGEPEIMLGLSIFQRASVRGPTSTHEQAGMRDEPVDCGEYVWLGDPYHAQSKTAEC